MGLDLDIFQLLNGFAKQSGLFDVLAIFFASPAIYMLGIGVIIIALYGASRRTQYYRAAFIALSLLIARGLIVPIMRFSYDRPRPFVTFPEINVLVAQAASEPSFPSGHATIAFALVGALYYLIPGQSWWKYAIVIAALIAIARVIVGVHYPLDIIVGGVVGWGSAWIVRKLLVTP